MVCLVCVLGMKGWGIECLFSEYTTWDYVFTDVRMYIRMCVYIFSYVLVLIVSHKVAGFLIYVTSTQPRWF